MFINIETIAGLLIFYLVFNFIIEFSVKFRNGSFCIYLFLLTIITGSVYEEVGLGGDYDNYRNIFVLLNTKETPTDEFGFYYLNLVIKKFTDNFYIAFLIFMFIINFLILKTIYEYSKQIELSILLYVIACGYVTSANIVRQYIAVAIYYYSVKFILKNDYIKFLILGVIAFQFHTTVVIPIVITIIVNIFNTKLNKRFVPYILFINSLIIIEPLIRKIGLEILDKGYTESSFNYGSSILHYLVQLAFVFFYFINKEKLTSNREKLFMNLSVIALGFSLLSQSMVLYARFASYFTLFNAILLPNILVQITNHKKKRLYYYFVSIGLLVYYLLLTLKGLNSYSGNYIIDFLRKLLL